MELKDLSIEELELLISSRLQTIERASSEIKKFVIELLKRKDPKKEGS